MSSEAITFQYIIFYIWGTKGWGWRRVLIQTHFCFCFPFQTILFTTDEDILLAVAEHDDAFQGEISCYHGDEEVEPEPLRPRTTDVGCGNSEVGVA